MSVGRMVRVIVNGVEASVRIDRRRNIMSIMQAALGKTHYGANDLSRWELRDRDGKLLEQPVSIRAYGITGGETLYLQPTVGIGA